MFYKYTLLFKKCKGELIKRGLSEQTIIYFYWYCNLLSYLFILEVQSDLEKPAKVVFVILKHFMKKDKQLLKLVFFCLMALTPGFILAQCNLLCNTDFDDNQVTAPAGLAIVDASQVPCWQTTATDNQIEIWNNGFNGVPAYSGNQFIELNAYMVSTIFQNFTVAPGTALTISFAHRGRQGVDDLGVEIGPVGGPYTNLGTYSDGNTAWGYYTVSYTVPMGLGNSYTLRFNSVSAAGGNPAVGNFLDAITVNLPYTVTLTPSSTDASCNMPNGTATVTATGGTAPYSYSWNSSPVQPVQTATGLGAGSYTVTVSDSNGCVNTASVLLNMDPQPTVEVSTGQNPLCDSSQLSWANWTSVNSTTGDGYISSDLTVTVTKPTGGLSTTGGMFNPTVFPTQYDVPVNSTAIRNDLAGLFTFCFNRPVVSPQIALSSIGNGGNSVQINTSVPYLVIWQGIGMSYPNNTSFIGTEGYTIIQFPGIHTCISFDYLQSETYCNLAFGTLDTNCQALTPPPICPGASDTLTASGALTYSWSPAAGLNTTSGAVVVAAPSVTTTYYVTGYDAGGCSDTDSITIAVNPPPAAAVTGDTVICAGDSTMLTASGGDSYTWIPGNLTGASAMLKPSATTTYTVIAANTSGCNDSAFVTVTVNPLPVLVVPPLTAICIGSSQSLTVSGASTYSWSLPTGLDVATGATVIASPLLNTTYTVTGTDTEGCVDTATVPVVVNPKPIVNVKAGQNPACDSTKLSWAAWSSVNATTGNGTISSNLSVTVTKPSGGLSTTGGMFNGGVFPSQYDVPANSTAIRNDLAGLFTFCFNVPVVNPQIAMASIGNSGNSVQINTSAPYQVIWQGQGMSYPNNTTFVGTEGFAIIQFPGIHTCISFDYLQSETYCNLAFGTLDTNCQGLVPPPLCLGQSDTLTASGALTYSWTPAAGLNTTTGATVVATPTVTTTYYVTGYDANNCSDTDSITLEVNALPIVTITGDTVICAGDSTTLLASGGMDYLWKPLSLTDSAVTVSPPNNTPYTVVVTNAAGCVDSAGVTVIVNPLPVAQFSVPAVCRNQPSVFSNTSTGNISAWNWNYDDGSTATIQSPSHTYATCDSFGVSLVVTTVDGCVDTAENTAVVYCLPVADFNFSDACMDAPVAFSDLSTVVDATVNAWDWNYGDNSAAGTSQNPSHPYSNYGPFNISLIVTSNQGCKDTAQQTINIHPLPSPYFTANNVCAGSIVPFSNETSIPAPDQLQSWVWDFADGSPAYNNPIIYHPYPIPGSYTVKLTVISDFGCADSLTQTILVHPNPVVNFAATDTIGCAPLCLSFVDMSTITPSPAANVQWSWDLGDGEIATSSSFDHCYGNFSATDATNYTVSLTVTSDSGCVTTKTKTDYISVYPNPSALFVSDPPETNSVNPIVTIQDLSVGADFWSWDFGDNDTTSDPFVASHTYADTGSFTITLVISNQYGCSSTAYQNVIIKPSTTFYVPNAFSPNGDGINDSFGGTGTFIREYSMLIFDRWGNFIFSSDNIEKRWDGKVDGKGGIAQQDTYVYVIEVMDIKKDKYWYRGIVSLVAGDKN